jgi:hypothetical protein
MQAQQDAPQPDRLGDQGRFKELGGQAPHGVGQHAHDRGVHLPGGGA